MEYFIGVDLGGTNIKAGLVSKNGEILKKIEVPTEAQKGRDTVLTNIKTAIKTLIEFAQNNNYSPIIGIGMGCPGAIDSEQGIIVKGIENIPSLNGFHIAKFLYETFGLPAFIDNDANNAGRGELLFGSARGYKNVICLTLGTGIGGAIIINGELYGGAVNYAGEVGHMVLIPDGLQCTCGKFGCWEAYASATAMIKKAISAKKREIPTKLKNYPDEEINAKLIVDLAKEGDDFAKSIVEETARYLGIGIASLVNILNPELVVVGGGVAQAGDILFKPMEYWAKINMMPRARESVKIVPAMLGNDAGILGSTALVIMKLLR